MRKSLIFLLILTVFVILFPSTSVFALIMSVTDEGMLYSSPVEPTRADGIIYSVNERQNYRLQNDLTAGSPDIGYYLDYPTPISISAGTRIDSHLLYYAPDTYNAPATTTITFDTDILGVIVTGIQLDNQLGNSDFLAVYNWPGIYDFSNEGRRLEMGDSIDPRTTDPFEIIDSHTIVFSMYSHAPWSDQVRIITAPSPVPEPATLLLLGSGMVAFLAGSRKKNRISN